MITTASARIDSCATDQGTPANTAGWVGAGTGSPAVTASIAADQRRPRS